MALEISSNNLSCAQQAQLDPEGYFAWIQSLRSSSSSVAVDGPKGVFERKDFVSEASGNGQTTKGIAGANRDLNEAEQAMNYLA